MYSTRQLQTLKTTIGVFCFSSNWDIITLWSYYSLKHQGLCIGFKTKELITKIELNPIKMLYHNSYPKIDPSNFNTISDYITQVRYKSSNWSHEEEFRFVKPNFANQKIYFDVNDIEEIILGYNIIASHKKEIIELVKKQFPSVKIYQIILHPKEFKLERELILF